MELDIQVGDRVTYKYENEEKVRTAIVNDIDELEDYITMSSTKGTISSIEIFKIERPQYEEIYKEGVTTHHITIETDKLKELILENHSNYIDYTLKDKIKTIKRYAEFDNDTDLLKFLELMEE